MRTPQRFDKRTYAWPALLGVILLLCVSVIIDPTAANAENLRIMLSAATPFVLVATAQALPVIAGNGGLDLSVGPLMGLVNAIFISVLAPKGFAAPLPGILICVGIGAASGFLNGILVTLLGIQPIIATLGTYLTYQGLTLIIMPSPGGTSPEWLSVITGTVDGVPGSFVLLAVVAVGWLALERSAFRRNLLAAGGDERAAYTAGVHVAAVRMLAYVIAGVLAALAGLTVTALLGSGDPGLGPSYTLASLASVALGGISLAGGRGGLLGAAAGAIVLYLIQNLLTLAHISILYLQIVYGAILLIALALNALIDRMKPFASNLGRTSVPPAPDSENPPASKTVIPS